MHAPVPIALIACEVFRSEIDAAAPAAAHIPARLDLEIALHDRPGLMRARLQQAINDYDQRDDIAAVVLAYGLCGLGTAGLRAGRHPLVMPRAHDCIGVFLGAARHAARQQACPGCYYYTAGWNRARRVPGPDREAALREQYVRQFDEETAEFLIEQERELWAHYHTAAFIDTGAPEVAAEAGYARDCAAALGWRFEPLAGDPSLLRDLLLGPWDGGRFLVIRPGERIAAATNERVVHAVPDSANGS
jgi:hypothetical protein